MSTGHDRDDALEAFLARAGAAAAGEGPGRLWREGREVGEWTVAGFVGRGGSAEVYCARHRRLGTAAVLKVLWCDGEGPRERFDRETRFLMEGPGKAFPAFYGAGVEEGRPWVAMELLEEYPLPKSDAGVAAYLLDVARGVAELHRRGWVHRDLKPRNILRRAQDGHAVLIDFGLLKRAGEDAAAETAAGRESPSVVDGREVGVGTPGYAAPEQFAGGAATPASDVHALGMLADECFGGKPPRAWERIIRRATGSLPRQRYADAAAMARAIRRRHWKRNMVWTVLACVAAVALWRVVPSVCESARRAWIPPPSPVRTIELPGGATMDLVWCPPGSFTMGSPDDEAGRRANEIRSEATLDEGFWMARTEVTQRQWKSVMGNRPSDNMGDVSADAILKRAFSVSWSNPYASDADADDLPVECVSWKECQEFCRLTGLQLPTETQWEYACRAGSDGPFAGTGVADQMGWFQGNGRFETHPVGRKRPNAWGLYDMHGNVAEWCEDEGWKGGGGDHPCGVRGGSYWYSEAEGRSARRCKVEARKRYPWLGFRPLFAGAEPPAVAGPREESAAGGAGPGDL